jgi:formylglycine-generating enzyme required for sulfatase activity
MSVKLINPALDKKGLYCVSRGGSWYIYPYDMRASLRDDSTPTDRNSSSGFRLVRNR